MVAEIETSSENVVGKREARHATSDVPFGIKNEHQIEDLP